jgi:hypothetical protein
MGRSILANVMRSYFAKSTMDKKNDSVSKGAREIEKTGKLTMRVGFAKGGVLIMTMIFFYLAIASVSAAQTKAMPTCVTYPVDYPSDVPPFSVKLWDDFNSDDFINTGAVISTGSTIVGGVFGCPPAVAAGVVGGFVTGMAAVGKDYLRANTQFQDVAYDLYVNPVGLISGWCLIDNPSVVDKCSQFSLPGVPSPMPFFYSELDYTTMKACCDIDKCNTLSGAVQCINTWQHGGIELSTTIKCINKYSSK